MRRVWKLLAAVTWKCRLTQVTQYSSGLSPLHSGGSYPYSFYYASVTKRHQIDLTQYMLFALSCGWSRV